ncbi:MAG: cell division protein FtsQ/DivIB, partial [Streptosporangiaceae bacterium]
PQVLSARVGRSWPDMVGISVRLRTPELAVAVGGGFELVDVHGVVVRMSATRPTGMPLLKSPPETLANSAAVRDGATVLASLPGSILARVLAVTATVPDGVSLELRGGVTVRWGDASAGAAKAQELRALLATGARYVDVSSPRVAVAGEADPPGVSAAAGG